MSTNKRSGSGCWFGLGVVLVALLLLGIGGLEIVGSSHGARASGTLTGVADNVIPSPPASVCAYIKVVPFNANIDPGIVINGESGITMNAGKPADGSIIVTPPPSAVSSTPSTSGDCYAIGGPVLLSGEGGR